MDMSYTGKEGVRDCEKGNEFPPPPLFFLQRQKDRRRGHI